MSKALARRKATRLLDCYWDRKIPVDPVAIAHEAGVRVVSCELGDDGVLSKLYFEEGRPVIALNPNEAAYHRRFSVAKQFGHFVLKHGEHYVDSLNIVAYGYEEEEAKEFAMELLMPKLIVDGLIEKRNISDFDVLLKKFGVPTPVMISRLKSLHWI